MQRNVKHPKKRNWLLVFISLILLALGLILVVIAIVYSNDFGVWSIPIGLSGAGTVAAASMSIIRNDPNWILLDLLLPL